MNEPFKPIAIVTGASRGIGRETAQRLAVRGWSVIVGYNKNASEAKRVVSEIQSDGGQALGVKADISIPEEAKALVEKCVSSFGPPSLLVNNAGVALWKLFTDCTDEEIQRVLNTDLYGAMILSREASKYMIKNKSGCIINVASMWGEVGASCEVVYSAAKAGIIGFTKALAKELAPSGIRVNCVSPGAVMTDMMKGFSKSDIETLRSDIPLGRLGTPSDVAETICFLASDSASYITGAVIPVNGGYVI